jgi:hypothetical protein
MNGQYLNFHTYEGYVYQTWSEAASFAGKAIRNPTEFKLLKVSKLAMSSNHCQRYSPLISANILRTDQR